VKIRIGKLAIIFSDYSPRMYAVISLYNVFTIYLVMRFCSIGNIKSVVLIFISIQITLFDNIIGLYWNAVS